MMVIRLLGFLLWYAAVIGGASYGGYRAVKWARQKLLRPVDEHKQLGQHNALLLKARVEETCVYNCGRPIDPQRDAFIEEIGGWTHPDCYQKATDIS